MKRFSAFFIVVTFLALQACDLGSTPNARGGGTGAEGVIVDGLGQPVAGARVRLTPQEGNPPAKSAHSVRVGPESTFTDAGGRYRFDGLYPGTYNLQASARQGDIAYALFAAGESLRGKTVDLGADTLRVSGSLRIAVRDALGAPLAGARCRIPGSGWEALSDAGGQCMIEGIAPGEYNVAVAAGGRTATGAATVSSGFEASASVDFAGSGDPRIERWRVYEFEGHLFSAPAGLTSQGRLTTPTVYWSHGFVVEDLWMTVMGGQLGSLPGPGTAEYEEYEILWSDSLKGRFVSYAVEQSDGFTYYSNLEIFRFEEGSWRFTNLRWGVSTEARSSRARARQILESVRPAALWSGPLSPPAKPLLLGPANDTSAYIGPITLSWTSFKDPWTESYRLEISPDSLFDSIVYADSIRIEAPGLPYVIDPSGSVFRPMNWVTGGRVYHWRVIARGPGGSRVSDSRKFSAGFLPPELMSPENGRDSVPVFNALVAWNPASSSAAPATSYVVQVSTDSLFDGMYSNDTLPAGTASWKIPFSASVPGAERSMLDGQLYFWRVIALGPRGSASSPVRSFITTPITPMPRLLVAPAQAATEVHLSPTLSWGLVADGDAARFFRVQVSEDSLFGTFAVNDSARPPALDGNHSWTVGPLRPNTRYFWRVLATGSVPEAMSSSVIRTFTTGPVTLQRFTTHDVSFEGPSDLAFGTEQYGLDSWNSHFGNASFGIAMSGGRIQAPPNDSGKPGYEKEVLDWTPLIAGGVPPVSRRRDAGFAGENVLHIHA